jgi:tetratricopeptide (TPR) repeat protein
MLILFLLVSDLSPCLDSLLLRAIDCSYVEDFYTAESLITIVKKQEADHPVPYFLLSSLYELKWVDGGENIYKDKIFVYADSAIDKGKKWVKKNPKDAWGYFFIGGSYTLKIFYYVLKEDYFGTILLINPAIYYLEKARNIDSTLADIYLGLGGWEYIKGKFPFKGKDKEKGLKMIRKAIGGAKYVSLYSSLAYANICIREEDYDEAILILTSLLDSFPNSRTFNWPFLKAYYGKKDYEKALNIVEKLIAISKDNNFSNFEAHYYKTKILFELGNLKEAQITADSALSIEVKEDMLHVKDIKKDLFRLKNEIKKKSGKFQ